MRKARMALVLAAAGGLWFGCSNSTGPAPTLAGTWHVSVGTLTAGTISPSSFDVVVTASGDSFLATIPTLTWSVGPVAYDTLASVEVVFDSNMVFLERPATSSRTCDFVLMGGNANTA